MTQNNNTDLESRQVPQGAICVDAERLRELVFDGTIMIDGSRACRMCNKTSDTCNAECLVEDYDNLIATLTAEAQGTGVEETTIGMYDMCILRLCDGCSNEGKSFFSEECVNCRMTVRWNTGDRPSDYTPAQGESEGEQTEDVESTPCTNSTVCLDIAKCGYALKADFGKVLCVNGSCVWMKPAESEGEQG